MQSLEHERAREAAEAVEKRFGSLTVRSEDMKKCRTILRGSSVALRQIGLLQLIAFWLSKVARREDGSQDNSHAWVIAQLMRRLTDAPVTQTICRAQDGERQVRPVGNDPGKPMAILPPLTERTATQLAILEAEAEAYLAWLDRITEGLYQSLDEPKRDEKDPKKETREDQHD